MIWFQKSRLEAIKDGDKNTKFFHLATVIRRHRNKVDMLQDINGQWVIDPSILKGIVVQYWSELFKEEDPNYNIRNFNAGDFPVMSSREMEMLNPPIRTL